VYRPYKCDVESSKRLFVLAGYLLTDHTAPTSLAILRCRCSFPPHTIDINARGRIPGSNSNFSLRHRVHIGSGAYPVSFAVDTKHHPDPSPPYSAAFKNARSYSTTSSFILMTLYRITRTSLIFYEGNDSSDFVGYQIATRHLQSSLFEMCPVLKNCFKTGLFLCR
jgi:hypothetical protein